MDAGLHCAIRDGIATLTLRNPAKRNAMTPAMWREFPELLAGLRADPAVRALVLTGHGGTFSAGADIGSLRDAEAPRDLATRAEEALAAFPRPTLAAVRGACVGGGCQLAVACDLRFAERGAVFGVTPARLGLVYPPGATRRLVRLVGPSAAKYLLFSAELIGTERALRTGLVDEVLPTGGLDGRVAEFTAVLRSRSALTQQAAKEFADAAGEDPGEDAGEDAGERPAAARLAWWRGQEEAAGEAGEGITAFLERRAPRFPWSPSAGPAA
ncbi:enoyl-CoA hydratase/isomerase family protein [Streptomyces aidingensis]|uniref:Enoyl-CoA hydratase/carnithine racemase n=1 Tax=Streptomyces aidingensis TaxID=910347 RepID=A0A1I1JBM4_9ACTN|nr:enoyl-CoA hydratase/isomerase family protein [Streptomyces aidingensis]SFC46009.1 Enoyl-CoA hydratase/carnithine racemase [Streptomyces aidingensis]